MTLFRSVRHKFLATLLLGTLFALCVAGGLILIYDINNFREARVNDMETQLELLTLSSAPALQYRDPSVAQENLGLLRIRPSVSGAAIYDTEGRLFASYTRAGTEVDFPPSPSVEGFRIEGADLLITRRIVSNGELLGTAWLSAEYRLMSRVADFLGILGIAALGALLVAIPVSLWLQALITRPILSIAAIARRVVSSKDYSRRAEKLSEDEVGTLVDAFNDMLDEIGRRTRELEDSNRELAQEVAERKRAREEVLRLNEELEKKVHALKEADRHKNTFLATLAHELRNPLAPIRSGLEVLRDADELRREDIYQILERQTHQLIRLVDDLMDMSRISRGKISLRRQLVPLEEVLRAAIESTRNLMEEKGHRFDSHLPRERLILDADPVRLTQVFLNLLSNAAHYTPHGGSIRLTAARVDDTLEVRIRDSGIGMAPDMLEKVFDPFIQAESALTRSQSGLGIGLTLARALLRLHGGSISAHSEGPNQGTEFLVRLPLPEDVELPDEPAELKEPVKAGKTGKAGKAETARKPATQVPAPPAAAESAGASRRVLVADDNEDAANTLAMLLRLKGHEVKVVFNGRDALEQGQAFHPDLILMDLGMPDMNGIEAARAIRRSDWGRDLTLVAVTGWGQDSDRMQTHDVGFDQHLVKPVTLEHLEKLLAIG